MFNTYRTRRHGAAAVTLPAGVSLLRADDVLRWSTVVHVRFANESHAGHVDGWTGTGSDVGEILVKIQMDCNCTRPCCSGSYTRQVEVSWDDVEAAFEGDDTLHDAWTGYADESARERWIGA